MDIVVCVKRVPLTEEVDIIIDDEKKGIKMDQLEFVLNDWDNYAIEEAILLKEKHGGTVTALTVGDEDDEEVLRNLARKKYFRVSLGKSMFAGAVLILMLMVFL